MLFFNVCKIVFFFIEGLKHFLGNVRKTWPAYNRESKQLSKQS